MKYKLAVVISCMSFFSCSKKVSSVVINDTLTAKATLLYQDDFSNGLEDWKIEQMEGGKAEIKDEKLEITDVSGCTIWQKQEFNGPIMITYDAFVINEGGAQDRVSDLNCFWMAKDPKSMADIFKNSEVRGGKFSNYDSLRLYYMGVGGHDNTKTRFRRYMGDGNRPLLPEYDFSESKMLLTPNKIYKIKIIAFDGVVQYYRNNNLLVDFVDESPYTSGHFGFRTVNNHMTIDNFKVYALSRATK
ncbi:DUF6250 domain-containing protein [Flavicella sediminum]|uniref:DUF6250 domain-containing protein n=1 Tax=Flavicella sediminum TaxID=2585141 RepID=UPI00140981B0|nr:DUF6250 domain-containing protein [Flavicella sediminum]